MIKRESLNCILVLIISVYVNFTFVYKTYPLFQYICYYGILGLYLLFHLKKVLHWVKLALKNVSISFFSLMFWIFILTNAIIFPIVHGTFDFSYINVVLSIARQIVQHCFLLVLIDNWIKPQKLTIKYMQINIGSGLCYVAVTVLMICFPHLKDFWRNTIYIPATDLAASYETNYFTRFGLVGFSGFDQTIFFTILVSFSLLLFFKNISLKENKNLYYFVSMIILLLGNTFYGRSGMMISLFCMGIGFSVFCFKYKQIRLILKLNIIFILLFLFVLIGKNYNEQLYVYYNWSLKPITNFLESGKIGTTSSDAMFHNMYFVPNLETILIGTGYYTDPETQRYFMATDIGYMRPLLFYGVINQLFGYLICVFLIISMTIALKKEYHKIGILFGCISLLILFIFELKGEVFYRISGVYFALLLSAVNDNVKIFYKNNNRGRHIKL